MSRISQHWFQAAYGLLILILMIQPVQAQKPGEGDGPELTLPSEAPPVVRPPVVPPRPPVTPPPTIVRPSNERAVLALPGLTRPTIRSTPAQDSSPADLPLDAPLEMKPGTGQPASTPGRTAPPLILEPPLTDEPRSGEGPTLRPNPSARRTTTNPQPGASTTPSVTRRPRFFGLLPGPVVPPPAPRSTTPSVTPLPSTTRTPPPGRSIVEEPRDDSAVQAALKARIERQARAAVGNRVDELEVRFDGKKAVIQARGVKLFQKRNVRKSLESIPALTGLRSEIDVRD